MHQQHQSLGTQPWASHQSQVASAHPSVDSDRALSQLAAERYALREALAERRRSLKPQQARPQRGWRRVRQTLSRTA